MNVKIKLLVSSALFFSGIALANNVEREQDNYEGARIGFGLSSTVLGETSTDYGSGIKAEYGYDFNKIIGVNLSYEQNNGTMYNYPLEAEFEGEMFKLSADIGYAFVFNKWSIKPYGLVGIARYQEDGYISDNIGVGTALTTSFTENNVMLGVGVRAAFNYGLYVDLRTQYIPVTDMELGQASLTIGYKFKAGK